MNLKMRLLGYLFGLFLLSNSLVAIAQPENEKDSLESLLPFANDLQRADILNGLANCVKHLDTTKAGNYARQSLAISNKINYCKGKSVAEVTLGILAKNGGFLVEAKQHFLTGLALGLKCKEPFAVSYAYHSLGNYAYMQGDYSKAMRYYIASVKISEQIGDKSRAARTYNNIGSLYMDLNNTTKAEEYYLLSLDLYKGTSDELIIAEIENNLANIYQVKGYQLKALYHYSNALEVFRRRSSSYDISSALHNIGIVYLSRRQAKKALPYFHESYRLDYQIGDSRSLILVLSNLARAYNQIGKLDSAMWYVQLGLDVAKKHSNLTEISDIYEVASLTYGKLNDPKKQAYYLGLKKQHDSQILNKAQRSEIGIAAAEYENDRKAQKLKLMEKENEINQLKIHEQELELESRNLILIAFSVVMFFLILIVVLVVYLLNLNRKNKMFEMGSLAKTSLLQQMNHEIRTPLNGIVGMSQLALESKTFTELKDYLAYIKQSSDDLMFVLNNLITFLQIERKEAYPIATPFNLLMSLEELFKIYSSKCKAKGLLFNQMVFPGVPHTINADKQKIMIMVANLLSNAVKFCAKGVVKIEVKQSATRVKEGVKYSTIQFLVMDEGEGLNEKEIKNLFKKANKTNSLESGFGIGLSNVKELSDLMKGHIEVISEKGVGSSFILELEVEDLEGNNLNFKPKKADNKIFEPRKYQILVVEDNLVNQALFSKILEKEGYTVSIVSNGLAALASLRNKSYDLIVMDVRLPEMDGIETTQHIRNRNEFVNDRNVPIIAITAHDDSIEKKRCFEVGMNDYQTKPINKEMFLDAIETQLLGKN